MVHSLSLLFGFVLVLPSRYYSEILLPYENQRIGQARGIVLLS